MSDLSQPAPATASEAAEYRPLSGLALTGFGLALFFALVLLVAAVVAFRSGAPLILHPSLLLIPALAAALCGLAWLRIVRSRGTQAGLRLAKLGLLITGLAIGAYLPWRVGKELAVQREAQTFADAWLDQLRQGGPHSLDSYIAFWQVLDPDRRDPRRPLDNPDYQQKLRDDPRRLQELQEYLKVRYAYGTAEKRVTLPRFLNQEVVQLVMRAGAQCQVKSTGMRSWDYRTAGLGGYLVELNYEITTPEGVFEAVVTVLGSHIENQPGRHWQTLLEGTALGPPEHWQLTPLGRNVLALRRDSREFVRDWVKKLSAGDLEAAFLDTRDACDRPLLRSLSRQVPVMALGSLATHDSAGPVLANLLFVFDRRSTLPTVMDNGSFLSGGLIQAEDMLAEPSLRPALLDSLRGLFHPGGRQPAPVLGVVLSEARLTSPWSKTMVRPGEERLLFMQPFSARVPPNLIAEGAIVVGTDEPELLQAIETPGEAAIDLPIGMRPLRWRIQSMDVHTGRIRADDE
ncbi:MAG: hypothetical protein JNM56_36665 [Planctomycetia bacterium]|nr:hypothetical protein [Planctomycetia bacterium]